MGSQVRHRGGEQTASSYRGIPVHASPNVHEAVLEVLRGKLPPGSAIADIGAGQGALSQRLHDAGFHAVAFDLNCEDWKATDVQCLNCDFNQDIGQILARGPFQAICAIDVIEHLENPRGFLRNLIEIGRVSHAWLIISTPNPLETFSVISMFTRGIFNWFSPAHYLGGGHISILPYWLIDEHLKYLGVNGQRWFFLAPYRHPSPIKRIAYEMVQWLRRRLSRSGPQPFCDGDTALMVVRL